MNPVIILGALAAAYILSSSNKKSTSSGTSNTSDSKNKPPTKPDQNNNENGNLPNVDDNEDLPNVNDEDGDNSNDNNNNEDNEVNIPDTEDPNVDDADKLGQIELPDVDPNQPKPQIPDQQGGNNIDLIMDKYYSKWLQQPGEKPAMSDPDGLWISDTCKSWAIGKYFVVDKNHHIAAYLPEKYVYPNKPNSNVEINPVTWWESTTTRDLTPEPWYEPIVENDMPSRIWVINLINLHSKCNINFPIRKNFKTYQEYEKVREQFAKTPMGQLLEYLTVLVSDVMYDAWAAKYPEKAEQEVIKGWALKAITENPKMIVGNQTDWAYSHYILGDKNAPKKIGPKDTKYKKLWTNLNIEIKNYLGYIKMYGWP